MPTTPYPSVDGTLANSVFVEPAALTAMTVGAIAGVVSVTADVTYTVTRYVDYDDVFNNGDGSAVCAEPFWALEGGARPGELFEANGWGVYVRASGSVTSPVVAIKAMVQDGETVYSAVHGDVAGADIGFSANGQPVTIGAFFSSTALTVKFQVSGTWTTVLTLDITGATIPAMTVGVWLSAVNWERADETQTLVVDNFTVGTPDAPPHGGSTYTDRAFHLTAYRYNDDLVGEASAHEGNTGEEWLSADASALNIAANFQPYHVHKIAAGGGLFTATVEYGAWGNIGRFAGSYALGDVAWPNFAFAEIVLTVRTWDSDLMAEVVSGTITVGPGWTWVPGNGGTLGDEPPLRPYWWYPPNDGSDPRPYPWYPPNDDSGRVVVVPRPGIDPPVGGWTEPITTWLPATAQVLFDVVLGADGEAVAVFPHVSGDEVAEWSATGEKDDLDERLVGQGLTLTAGGGVVWRYATDDAAAIRIQVETGATTWTAPAAARTPSWS